MWKLIPIVGAFLSGNGLFFAIKVTLQSPYLLYLCYKESDWYAASYLGTWLVDTYSEVADDHLVGLGFYLAVKAIIRLRERGVSLVRLSHSL